MKTNIRVSNCPHENIRGYIEGVSRRFIVERTQEGHSMTSISSDMLEPGAPAGTTSGPEAAATDDDSGDGDGEPARRGRNGKAPIPAGMEAQENVTSKEDFKSGAALLEVLARIAAALEKQNALTEAQIQAAEENTQSIRQAIHGVSNRMEDMGRFA